MDMVKMIWPGHLSITIFTSKLLGLITLRQTTTMDKIKMSDIEKRIQTLKRIEISLMILLAIMILLPIYILTFT